MKNTERPDSEWTNFRISMASQENFYGGEDLEAILEAVDKENWDKGIEFTVKVDILIR